MLSDHDLKVKFDSDDEDVLEAYQHETNGEYQEAIDHYHLALKKILI
jgi:hypothetical protein